MLETKRETAQMSKLIEVSPEVFVDPSEVVSVEHDVVKEYESFSPSDCDMRTTFDGSRIILKNGRKVFVNGVMPSLIMKMLGL